jgi:predicted RNA-binding protein associated with RNAse of E/G family
VKVGLLSPETADQAVQTATTTIDGLASHGYDLDRWLGTSGMELTWPGA